MRTKKFRGDYSVTSPFGWRTCPLTGKKIFHYGVDFGCPVGTEILGLERGGVVSVDHAIGKIKVKHATFYNWDYHLSEIYVKVGSKVTSETVLGLSGKKGNATGYHLHTTISPDSNYYHAVDPIPYITYQENPMTPIEIEKVTAYIERMRPDVKKNIPRSRIVSEWLSKHGQYEMMANVLSKAFSRNITKDECKDFAKLLLAHRHQIENPWGEFKMNCSPSQDCGEIAQENKDLKAKIQSVKNIIC